MMALTLTIYATMSCRFVVLTFSRDRMDINDDDGSMTPFEAYFQQRNTNSNDYDMTNSTNSDTTSAINAVYRTSLGLYQWLRPLPNTETNNSDSAGSSSSSSSTITDWTVGTCVGYQQTMLEAFQQPSTDHNVLFDVSRIMAIFAILLGLFQFSWMLLSACMSMNRIQMYLFLALSVCGTAMTGLTFLFHQSSICTTEFDHSAYCQIDQGGLVMIAAMVVWFITFLISIYYVAPVVRVISTTDSIDFELHTTRTPEQKQKLALQREIYKELRRQQKEQRAMKQKSSSNTTSSHRDDDDLPLFITPRKPVDTNADVAADAEAGYQVISSSRMAPPPLHASVPVVVPHANRTQRSQPPPTNHDHLDSIPIRNSYSYDSKESWLRPIPKRSMNNRNHNPKSLPLARHFRSMSLEQVPVATETNPHSSNTAVSSSTTVIPPRPSSLSRLIPTRPLSLSRIKKLDHTTTSSSSSISKQNIILVESQETGDIEVQQTHCPEHLNTIAVATATSNGDTRRTATTTPMVHGTDRPVISSAASPQQSPIPPPSEPPIVSIPPQTTTTAVCVASSSLPPKSSRKPQPIPQPIPPVPNNDTVLPTTNTTKAPTQSKTPVDVYIAQRLDTIEMLL